MSFEQELLGKLEAHFAQESYGRMLRMASDMDLTKKATKAVEYAVRSQKPDAVSLALRELDKLAEEEGFAISAALALA